MTPDRKTITRALIWIVGIALCIFISGFFGGFSGPPGRQWMLPIQWPTPIIWFLCCAGILMATYLLDKYSNKK
jgi:hypothetical protein